MEPNHTDDLTPVSKHAGTDYTQPVLSAPEPWSAGTAHKGRWKGAAWALGGAAAIATLAWGIIALTSDGSLQSAESDGPPPEAGAAAGGSGAEAPVTDPESAEDESPDTTPGALPGEPWEVFAGEVHVVGVRHDDALNVRVQPGVEFDVVTTLPPTGAAVATGSARILDGGAGTWIEIEADGGTGWANTAYLLPLADTDDITSAVVTANDDAVPSADTMDELGLLVAELLVGGGEHETETPTRLTVTVAATVGDLGEVTVDAIGIGDDAVAGWRLHVFANPDAERFVLRSVEATVVCWRGLAALDDGTIVCL